MSEDQEVVIVHRSPTQRKGFAQIPHAVLTDPALSDGCIRLYGILLSYAFQGESFKCGQVKMGRDIGKDDRTVRRLLKELQERGLVTPVRQGQRMVNIYILEDAYALYDGERPEPKKRTRTAAVKQPLEARNEIRQDKNVRSEGDRTKMSGHAGQKCPVMQDKNVLLLKTPEKKEEKKRVGSENFASLFEEPSPEPERPVPLAWVDLAEAQQPWLEQARRELVAIHAGSGITPKPKLVEVRAKGLYEVSQKEEVS